MVGAMTGPFVTFRQSPNMPGGTARMVAINAAMVTHVAEAGAERTAIYIAAQRNGQAYVMVGEPMDAVLGAFEDAMAGEAVRVALAASGRSAA